MDKKTLDRIVMEEVAALLEGFGGRGGRYRGGDTTGYRGRYSDTPWYRQGGSGRMSDAEAREMGARGYDEPDEPDYPRGPRGGLVHSTVTIYTDPTQASDKFNANLGPRLDSAADVFIGKTGYDGMSGNFVTGRNPETGYNDVGARWVLAKSPEGFTFTTGGTVGTGSSPSAALRDAAQQGFEGSDVVLSSLGMGGGMATLSESRWSQLAGLMTEGRKSTGEKRLFASPPHDLDASEKDLARGIGLDVKGDSVVGTMKQQRAFYERLAQKAKKTGPASVPPFDKDAYELVDGPEEVDEGSGAAPGSDPKRLPKPPNPKKDGPPGKEDLDKIKNLGPFERKKR